MPRLLAHRPLRRPFVVTLAVVGTLAGGAGACGGSVSGGPLESNPDAASTPDVISHNPPEFVPDGSFGVDCPSSEPTQGSACTGGGTCSYPSPDCPASDTATCQGGTWEVLDVGCSHNPPYIAPDASVACPVVEPEEGSACSGGGTCSYTSTYCAPASDTASCQGGTWEVEAVDCSHNPPAMVPDASSPPRDAVAPPPGVDAGAPTALCPADEPTGGTPCKGLAGDVCSYPSADCYGYSDTASCQAGVWEVEGVACSHNPPPTDAG